MPGKNARHTADSRFLDLADERVVIFDGAFGTYLQTPGLPADDFGGPDLEGRNAKVVLTRPDPVADRPARPGHAAAPRTVVVERRTPRRPLQSRSKRFA